MVTTRAQRRRKELEDMYIPEIIISDILSRLPAKSLLRFKCVCKSWYSLLNHPVFINLHLSRSMRSNTKTCLINRGHDLLSLEFDDESSSPFKKPCKIDLPFKTSDSGVVILGSCNGILLISIRGGGRFIYNEALYLWNPSTKEYKRLPETLNKSLRAVHSCHIAYGLGYDSSSDDYKVIMILYYDYSGYPDDSRHYESDVHVYSMRKNSCKKIQDVPYLLESPCPLGGRFTAGIYTNGAIHWLGTELPKIKGAPITNDYYDICSFDVANEEYKKVPHPDIDMKSIPLELGLFKESLLMYTRWNNDNVFIIMKEYGVKDSWTQIFSIRVPPSVHRKFVTLFCVTSNGKFLLSWDCRGLALYDPRNGSSIYVKRRGLLKKWFFFFLVNTYASSLVSLKASTCLGVGTM